MQAIVLEQRGRTGAGWRDFLDPKPAADESVLKVRRELRSIGSDLYMRDSGAGITHHLPQVMGVEAAPASSQQAEPGNGLRPGMKAVLGSEAFLRPMPVLVSRATSRCARR